MKGYDITHLKPALNLIKIQEGLNTYYVDEIHWTCSCEDYWNSELDCKHVIDLRDN